MKPFLLLTLLLASFTLIHADPPAATYYPLNGAGSLSITSGTTVTLARLGSVSTYLVTLASGTAPYTATLILSDTAVPVHAGDKMDIAVSYPASTYPTPALIRQRDFRHSSPFIHRHHHRRQYRPALHQSDRLQLDLSTGGAPCSFGTLVPGVQSALQATPGSAGGLLTTALQAGSSAAPGLAVNVTGTTFVITGTATNPLYLTPASSLNAAQLSGTMSLPVNSPAVQVTGYTYTDGIYDTSGAGFTESGLGGYVDLGGGGFITEGSTGFLNYGSGGFNGMVIKSPAALLTTGTLVMPNSVCITAPSTSGTLALVSGTDPALTAGASLTSSTAAALGRM